MTDPTEYSQRKIEFETLRKAIQTKLDLGQFSKNRLELKTWHEYEFGHMAVVLSTDVLARVLVRDNYFCTELVPVPASWWQQLKEEHAPAWFKKRWPVQKRDIAVSLEVKFARYATYPMADIDLPKKFGHMVIYEQVKPEIKVVR